MFVLMVMLYKVITIVGFRQTGESAQLTTIKNYQWLFTLMGIVYLLRAFLCVGFMSFKSDFYLFLSMGAFLFLSFTMNIDRSIPWLNNRYFYSLIVLGLSILEFSRFDIRNITLVLNPAQLFMASFGLLILAGTALLKLPNATYTPISLVDAFFTATSAICVTGLVVVDTATSFTGLGKSILLILIQIGGIGIMTFTSFFGLFFKGGSSSFSESFVLGDFLSLDSVSEITKTLAKVIYITLIFEAAGAVLIYFNLDTLYFESIGARIRFSVFHAVSAFCNAGFSTMTNGLNDFMIRGTYPVLYVISFLIILGGIGFPILLNLYTYLKYRLLNLVSLFKSGHKRNYIPMMINVNSRLVIYTTCFLLLIGTVFFFVFENDHTLKDYDLSGKIAHSFLGSVTPRTAGFNSVNMGQLSIAAVVLTIFLMWIGASPVSTGGGIKTSTFAIALLNALRIARKKKHIEFHKREFHESSVDKAFAIIILSIIILGCSSLIMYLIEPDKGALNILFECVSAFGTVGLSLGITPFLTDASKILLIMLMYMGRMGILTLLFAFFRSAKTIVYRYPKENIVIN
jgi:Trk-type K+ transport system membrane component